MILEKVNIADIRLLQEVCIAAYTQNFAHHWEENGLELYLESQFNPQRLTIDIANPNLIYYFIKEQTKPIGFIKVSLTTTLEKFKTEEVAELEKIYVLPEMKGQGIGKKALRRIIEEMKATGKKVLFLCVIDTNKDAIAFYKKLGFKFHSTTTLAAPFFKEALKGMYRMVLVL